MYRNYLNLFLLCLVTLVMAGSVVGEEAPRSDEALPGGTPVGDVTSMTSEAGGDTDSEPAVRDAEKVVLPAYRTAFEVGNAGPDASRFPCGNCVICDAACWCIGVWPFRECFCAYDYLINCNMWDCFGDCY